MAEDRVATTLIPPSKPVPSTYFGMHVLHLIDAKDTDWPTIPFGTWRLWDSHVSWNLLEPQRGVYDFSLLDQYVAVAKERNVQLILTLALTPPWAASNVSAGGHGGSAPPKNLDDWQAFVHTVASRYKGKIRYYEIWNEPEHSAWFSGTVQQLFDMDATAYTAIKTADPNAVVLSPPVDGNPIGLAWLNKFLAMGGGKYVDLFAFHLYVGSYPETIVPKYKRVKEVLAKYGQDDKPVWNTEAGWPFYRMDPTIGAQYVARAYIVNWASGLGRLNMYAWDHPRLGIAPSGTDTPLSRAYQWIAKYLQNAVMTRCVELENGTWIANLTMPDKSETKLAWYPTGTVSLDAEHVGNAKDYIKFDGSVVKVTADSRIPVSRSPILLRYPTH